MPIPRLISFCVLQGLIVSQAFQVCVAADCLLSSVPALQLCARVSLGYFCYFGMHCCCLPGIGIVLFSVSVLRGHC